jgi:DNA helicase II / ATP-dependent DNA helicase PcrA
LEAGVPPDPWNELKARMGSRLHEVVLETNYRATEKLASLASSMRRILRSETVDPVSKLAAMKRLLDRLPPSPVSEKLNAEWAGKLPNGSVAILTRTNGEAMRVAGMLLGRADGPAQVDLRLKLAGTNTCAPAWIAALLSAFRPATLSLAAFPAVYAHAEREIDAASREALALPSREQAWKLLTRASGAPDTANALDVATLRQRLTWPDSFPDDEDAGRPQILITTIHQAKGMEFDNVELLESLPRGGGGEADPLEEANVGFVAISRAGRQIRRIAAEAIFKPPYEKSFRHGRSRQVSWGKMVNFQAGVRGDLDAVSFVDEEVQGSAEQVAVVQRLLMKSAKALRSYKVSLRKVSVVAESNRARDARYDIALHGGEFDGVVLGRTEIQFTEDLLDLLWSKGYGLPQQVWNLRVGEVATLTPSREEQRAIPEPWRSSLLWLGVTVIGTGDFVPTRRNNGK